MNKTQTEEVVAAKPPEPMTAGRFLAWCVMLVVMAAVLGFAVALGYATFFKTCSVMGVG